MEHVRKICPICGREFFVLENVEEKAVYCTLECLAKAQEASEIRKDPLPVEQ
ncbi:MAG: hypothetical protein AB3K77_11500 [Methanosarcinaceae archaeon]|uniref:hypothetical protein n=1 Tax=Methanosarcina sp. MTP4 TaxID=1434100 RepID=UPI000B083BF6|nr:hypothetical protein [Methanosarcina sp. MTP4]